MELTRVRVGEDLYNDVLQFLYTEARLLDDDDLGAWLELLAPELKYIMPVRETVLAADGQGFSDTAAYYDDDLDSIRLRVSRVQSAAYWAESPPSRTHRIVSNVLVDLAGDDLIVTSSLILLRSRWDLREPDLLSAKRHDTLRRLDGALRIARRQVLVDQTNMHTPNLAVLF
ncbi:MAG: hypothetical protein QOI86_3799 [Actinomycetota bacterium]|nr:hypothetical protein [Actinomycetota bacterium]